ncbi:MAG: hypothetical protein RJB66_2680 [Pseudomonadota bacterium]|jgi:uncharacterized membrane protein YfcA
MLFLGYLASVFMGVTLGLLGGGGSILTVPILVYLFKVPPATATVYSLFVVGATTLLGSYSYMRSRTVDFKTVALFGIPSLTGVFLMRTYIVPSIPTVLFSFGPMQLTKDALLMVIFAVLMLLASISMIRAKATPQPTKTQGQDLPATKKKLPIIGQGIFVGGVTGLVGAGGGFLIIPALIFFRGLSMRLAVGTSLVIITINSLFGFANNLATGLTPDWRLLLTLALIATIGIQLGTRMASKTDEKFLKKAFGYFVLLMGSFILIQQIIQMKGA